MKIAIIPDSFKEGPDAFEIANSIEQGILSVNPYADISKIPVSDGGDGLANRLIHASSGRFVEVSAVDPLGHEIKTHYGVIDKSDVAVIESALTCGLSLVPNEKRDPTITTSYGLGMVLKKVVEDGFRDIIIGLGGSATNDAGAGLLQAMGVRLSDENNKEIGYGGLELKKIKYIDSSALRQLPVDLNIKVACNPSSVLCGPNSTSLVYARQKGANEEQIYQLDEALFYFGLITHGHTSRDVRYLPGSGGAGGIGAALNAYLNADLVHSIEIIKKYLPLEEEIRNSDIVISAEGRFDERSLGGKIVGEIGRITKKYGKPFFVLCGQMPENLEFSYHLVDGVLCISNGPRSLDESITNTLCDLQRTSSTLANIYNCFVGSRYHEKEN